MGLRVIENRYRAHVIHVLCALIILCGLRGQRVGVRAKRREKENRLS
jgi:hypothetical protein